MSRQPFVLFCVLFTFAIIAFSGTVYAQNSEPRGGFPDLLSKWFPTVFKDKSDEGPDPSETLRAPFADSQQNAAPSGELGDLYQAPTGDGTGNLAVAHRHDEQISEWLQQKVSYMLTIDPNAYPALRQEISEFTTPKGLEEYEEFLKTTNIIGVLQRSNKILKTFIPENPCTIYKDTVSGRYRWLMSVNDVNLSLVDPNKDNYQAGTDPVNRQIFLQVQVGRIKNLHEGLQIESWNLKTRRNDCLG